MDSGHPSGKFQNYSDRLLAICLIQGAAQHFVDTRINLPTKNDVAVDQAKIDEKGYRVSVEGQVLNGVKDIDVMLWFRRHETVSIPVRNHARKSTVCNLRRLGMRRFDFMKKAIPDDFIGRGASHDPMCLVRRYMEETNHGRQYLARKSAIGLYPDFIFGQILWASRRFVWPIKITDGPVVL